MSTVTRVSTMRATAAVFVIAHLDDGGQYSICTERARPAELLVHALELEQKIARYQRHIEILRQAAAMLEA